LTTVTAKIEGVEDCVRALQTLPRNIQRRAVGKAVRAGGAPFTKAAKRNAPKRSGIFKRSLTSKQKSYKGGAHIVAIIGQQKGSRLQTKKAKRTRGGISGRGDVVPIHLVEMPTKPHAIQAKTVMMFESADVDYGVDQVFVKRVQHPGTRGQQPMRKAAQEAERPGLAAFEAKLTAEVDKEAASL